MAEIISTATMRVLADSKQDIRKKGALEIESQIKALKNSGDWSSVRMIIQYLHTNFTRSVQPSQRKGGLLALAATAVALYTEIGQFLQDLIQPVIECFSDTDSTVRFQACESMYNIAKVARAEIITFFAPIFDGLVKLCGDSEQKVQNATYTLDRIIKDIATETETFNIPQFIGLVKRHITSNNPYVRQFLVAWLMALDAVPDINIVKHLPEYLDGLLVMLSDRNKEIVQMVELLLVELKRGVHIDGSLVKILISHCSSEDDRTRLVALKWLHECLQDGKENLLPYSAELIPAMFPCISDKEEAIRTMATQVNDALAALVQNEGMDRQLGATTMIALQGMLVRAEVRTRIATLHWILMLLDKNEEVVLDSLDNLFPLLLRTLSDASSSEEVVVLDLSVLARLSKSSQNFEKIMHDFVDLLKKERKRLLTRSNIGLIVRNLSELINPEQVFCALASILTKEEDTEFVSTLVQILNMIMLTSAELLPLRSVLKKGLENERARKLLIELYYCWSYNPVATLSLCLLTKAYEHSYALVKSFAEMEVTVSFLTQIDKLVQLLESPIFAHVRLQLLEPSQHPYLVKALFGILMLLPQSSAYDLLKNRLKSVSTLNLTNWIMRDMKVEKGSTNSNNVDWDTMFAHFTAIQQRLLYQDPK